MAFCICIDVHWSGRQRTVILPAMRELQRQIESYYAMGTEAAGFPEAGEVFSRFRDALTAGTIRAAEKADGRWRTHEWVKQGILLGFRIGKLAESGDPSVLRSEEHTSELQSPCNL